MKKDFKTGVVHGRFQPFHIGHLDYVITALKHCDYLFIGIANPDPSLTKEHHKNLQRAKPSSNPFTYYDRMLMINLTLDSMNIPRDRYSIVPFPINYPQYIEYYVPTDATFFMTIYDDWGYAKKESLLDRKLKIKVLEEGSTDLKIATGTIIRNQMLSGENWHNQVPDQVKTYILENNLIQNRLKRQSPCK